MRRRNAIALGSNGQQNEDSDQSISEDEEGLEGEWPGNTISLGGAGDHKGALQVLSQLEILRDSCELHSTEKESISSHEMKGGYPIDDEVENPLFNDEDHSSHNVRLPPAADTRPSEGTICFPTMASILHSGEDIISDDDNPPSPRSSRQDVRSTWSEAGREVEALVRLNENSSCSSSHVALLKEHKTSRGGSRTKGKPKFLFRFHSHKEDTSLVFGNENARKSSNEIPVPDEIGGPTQEHREYESQLIFHEGGYEQLGNQGVPFEQTNKHDLKEHSVVEFLDCFKGRRDLLLGSSELEIKKGKAQRILKRDICQLGDRNLDEYDLSEALDTGSPICSDDEEIHPPKMIVPMRTMADQFHENFGTVSVVDQRPYLDLPKPSCDGLYGKLQQVMQSEKDRDMDYLKNIHAATDFKRERMSIPMRILTRSLEAKLIACSCTFVDNGKNIYWDNMAHMKLKGAAKTLTIIFNPRVCNDVELEVGSLIDIHPPWKEVQVNGKDEIILLCSYFSRSSPEKFCF